MPKRKREQCEVLPKRRRLIIYSDSSDFEDNLENEAPIQSLIIADPPQGDIPAPMADDPVQEAPAQIVHDSAQEVPVQILDPEILTALGDITEDLPRYGENIHENLPKLWLPILCKGLPAETKDKLMKEYIVPDNCRFLQAPRLNPEISAAISDLTRNRDKKIESVQQQIGIGITAVSRALTILLSGDSNSNRVSAIKSLSDACRILSELHFAETRTRTKLITPCLDKAVLNVIQEDERDETLFGSKLSDKIRASKAIEKQSLQIKKVLQQKTSPLPTTPAAAPRQGNWQGPRFPLNRGGRGGQRRNYPTAPPARRAPYTPPHWHPHPAPPPRPATSQREYRPRPPTQQY